MSRTYTTERIVSGGAIVVRYRLTDTTPTQTLDLAVRDYNGGAAMTLAFLSWADDYPVVSTTTSTVATVESYEGIVVLENRTADPESPATGRIWLRTDV